MSRRELILFGVLAGLVVLLLLGGVILAVRLSQQRASQLASAAAGSGANGSRGSAPFPTVSLPPTRTPTAAPTEASTATALPSPRPVLTVSVMSPLQAALSKTNSAPVYRFEYTISAKGDLGLPAATGPNQELAILAMTGEVSGGNTHTNIRGYTSYFLGTDVRQGVDVLVVGGKTFLHGPVAALGALEDKWYVMLSNQPPDTKSAFEGQFLNTSSNLDWSGFGKSGTEALDGHRCDIYNGDRSGSLGLFSSLGAHSGLAAPPDSSRLDSVSAQVWVCDDGFIHQVRVNLEGRGQSGSDKNSMNMSVHIYDLNANFKLTPPVNPIPLQPRPAPDKPNPTPTKIGI